MSPVLHPDERSVVGPIPLQLPTSETHREDTSCGESPAAAFVAATVSDG